MTLRRTPSSVRCPESYPSMKMRACQALFFRGQSVIITLLMLVLAAILAPSALAQGGNFGGGGAVKTGASFSGTCSPNTSLGVVTGAGGGAMYDCPNGSWFQVSAGSSSGTVTSFSIGNLSPLFTTSVATATTTPAVTFSLTSTISGDEVFGNCTGSTGSPSFCALTAAMMPTSVPTSVSNDTNVTGSISGNTLTLGWTGTLAAGRLNSNVVQSIVNDTNVTGSIATQALTLGWTGTLAVARGGSGVGTLTGPIKGNGTSAFSAAAAADIYGLWSGTCSSNTFLRGDGSCQTPSGSISGLTTGYIPQATGTSSIGNSSPALDNGVTAANTLTYSGTGGISAQSFTASGSGAGYFQCAGGTAPSTVSSNIQMTCPSGTVTTQQWVFPNAPATGILHLSNSSGTVTLSISAISLTADVTGILPVGNGGSGVGTISGVIKGNGTSAFSAAASSDVTALWTGSCSSSTFLRGDGSCATPSGSGNVTGPGSSTNTDLASFSGTSGTSIQDTGIASGTVVTAASSASAAKQICTASGASKTCSYIDFPDVKVVVLCGSVAGTASGAVTYASGQWTPTNATSSDGCTLNATPSTGATLYFDFEWPGDADTSDQPYIDISYSSLTNTSGTVIWTVSSACTKQDGSVSDDPSYNAESAFASQTMATASRNWGKSGQFTAIASGNNCIPGSPYRVKVVLSGTASAAIGLNRIFMTTPRLLTVQAN